MGEEGCRRYGCGSLEEEVGGWGRGYVGGRGYKGGGLSRITYKFSRMERVEHRTTTGYDVMNEDGI